MPLKGLFANEKFLLGFLALNLYIIWMVIYFPYFEDPKIWFIQITVEVVLIYLSVLHAYFFLVPKFLYREKYIQFVLGILLFMAVQTFAIMVTYHFVVEKNVTFSESFSRTWMERIFATRILWVIIAVGIKVYLDQIKMSKRLSDTLREKTQSDLDFLKAQIAPHFLFNGLNTIFFRIPKENKNARETLVIFASLLRYQLYESQKSKVFLSNEISYLASFVNFYRIRMGDRIAIELNSPASVPAIEVHPLLFSPLIENAFKYVSQHESEPNIVRVNLSVVNNEVMYVVENTTAKTNYDENSAGIGLQNLKKRLQLVYPDKHELMISLNDNIFRAQLKLKID